LTHDIEVFSALGQKIEGLLNAFPGTVSVLSEQISGGDYIDVQLDFSRLEKYGIKLEDAMLYEQTKLNN